jgi:hypothetical protein
VETLEVVVVVAEEEVAEEVKRQADLDPTEDSTELDLPTMMSMGIDITGDGEAH